VLNKPLGSIAELYNSDLFSDVVITCGKVSVKAHKAVLSTHSDTFLQAFKNQAVGKWSCFYSPSKQISTFAGS
jgi:hypothetical protein